MQLIDWKPDDVTSVLIAGNWEEVVPGTFKVETNTFQYVQAGKDGRGGVAHIGLLQAVRHGKAPESAARKQLRTQ